MRFSRKIGVVATVFFTILFLLLSVKFSISYQTTGHCCYDSDTKQCNEFIQRDSCSPEGWATTNCNQYDPCILGCCKDPRTGKCISTEKITKSKCTYLEGELAIVGEQDSCLSICPTQAGKLSGKVLSVENNAPISNAQISIAGTTANSSSDGSYTISGISAGTYSLTVMHTNYVNDSAISLGFTEGEQKTLDIYMKQKVTGTINFNVYNSTGMALPGATVVLTKAGFSQSKITDNNGNAIFSNIEYGTYTATARKDGYIENTTSVSLQQGPIPTVILKLMKQRGGTVKGRIIDNSDPAKGRGISGVKVSAVGIDASSTSDDNGNYYLIIPVSAKKTVTINAINTNYNPNQIQVDVEPDKELTGVNIYLDPVSSSCRNPNSRPPYNFSAEHVVGQRKVHLIWKKPNCTNNLAGYNLYRSVDGGASYQNLAFITNNAQYKVEPQEYYDDNVNWSKAYFYKLSAVYDDIQIRSSENVTASIITGKKECEGKYSYSLSAFTEFCLPNQFGWYVQRVKCDNKNQIVDASKYPETKLNCADYGGTPQNPKYVCTGPDTNGKTICREITACEGPLAGAFGGLGIDEQACIGSSSKPTYCYWDYSKSITNECYSCAAVDLANKRYDPDTAYYPIGCFSYKSKEACTGHDNVRGDNCRFGSTNGCGWVSPAFEELGKGICYNKGYKGTKYCGLCSTQGKILQNIGCTQSICNNLGLCYLDYTGSCQACDNATCYTLGTKEACDGGTPFKINIVTCYDTSKYRTPFSFTLGKSACSLEKCKWINNKTCVKDADDDNVDDCAGLSQGCRMDIISPKSNMHEYPMLSSARSISIKIEDENVEDAKIVYCVGSSCCPNREKQVNRTEENFGYVDLTYNDLKDLIGSTSSGNDYVLRYYAIDSFKNVEILKSGVFYADLLFPLIKVDYSLNPNTEKINDRFVSELTFNIKILSGESALCNDELTRIGESNPRAAKISLSSEPIFEGNSTYKVEDGYYNYKVSCVDKAGNSNSTEIKNLLIDAYHLINVISPKRVVNNATITFEITTDEEATNCKFRHPMTGALIQMKPNIGTAFSSDPITVALPNNINYKQFSSEVICQTTDPQMQIDNQSAVFTVDLAPPLTAITLTSYPKNTASKIFTINTSNWQNWARSEERPRISFNCIKVPEDGFECKSTMYCESTQGSCGTYNMESSIDYASLNCFCSAIYLNCSQSLVYLEIGGYKIALYSNKQNDKCMMYKGGYGQTDVAFIEPPENILLDGNCYNYLVDTIEGSKWDKASRDFPSLQIPDCTPDKGAAEYELTSPSKICYSSIDEGENKEKTKCGIVHMDEPSGISLILPPYSESKINVFDVKIATMQPTQECRYYFYFNEEDIKQFDSLNMKFTKLNDYEHIVRGFKHSDPENPYKLAVLCKTTDGYTDQTPARFKIHYNPTAPKFDPPAHAVPNHVNQYPYDTTLIVDTDDLTICEYQGTLSNPGTKKGVFDGWDKGWNPSVSHPIFRYHHEVTLHLLNDDNGKVHKYTIHCINRAGLDASATITFDADFTESGIITSKSPQGSIKPPIDNIINLNLTTNKNAVCSYYKSSTIQGTFEGSGTMIHTETLRYGQGSPQLLDKGQHTFLLKCTFSEPYSEVQDVLKFSIDSTPPTLTINTGTKVCRKDKLSISFSGKDDIGVEYYNYSIWEEAGVNDINAKGWVRTNVTNLDVNISLTVGKTYYVAAKAIDAAGWESDKALSQPFIVLDPNSADCANDNTPPKVEIIKNKKPEGIEAEIRCTDNFGACTNILYALSANLDSCSPTEPYTNILLVKETSKLCYSASDHNNNTAAGSEIIEINDGDRDGIIDDFDECKHTPQGELVDEKGCSENERDTDGDEVPDVWEKKYTCMDPNSNDDGIGCKDKDDKTCDKDQDGLTNWEEYQRGADPCDPDSPGKKPKCEEGKDSDNDGMPDCWEIENGLNPNDPSDADLDNDNDGLTNIEEYRYGTDPNNRDTDGDGFSDKEEILAGTDPLDPNSYPKRANAFAWILLILGILLFLGGMGYLIYSYMYPKEKKEVKQYTPTLIRRPLQPTKEQLRLAERKRGLEKEMVEKRRELKQKRREKVFEVFGGKGAEKPKEGAGRAIVEHKKKMPVEFEKLAKITEERVVETKETPSGEKKAKEKYEEKMSGLKELSDMLEEAPKKYKVLKPAKKESELFEELGKLSKTKPEKKEEPFSELKKIIKPTKQSKGKKR